ncbi:hypothetical protein KAR91_10720 [Candidatus Pacearchaeota archaeon]|nr:hypothetical protein [Candidatus Pacearchaeota archaeon]
MEQTSIAQEQGLSGVIKTMEDLIAQADAKMKEGLYGLPRDQTKIDVQCELKGL